MKIQYTLDDSAARLPLAMRSADSLWDRVAELRNVPGIRLVELTTQHMQNTGAALVDELAHYFETGNPTESDPYALATCYAQREMLEDLLRDLRDMEPGLAAFHEVEALFPASFEREMHFTLALTAVGFPAFGYVRTYKDSEGDQYHGMVVNLAQARPHLELVLGQFSVGLLVDTIRHGFFNHEGFQLAYTEYCQSVGRVPDKPLARLKDALLSQGIAWYLSYRHDQAFYDEMLGITPDDLAGHIKQWNALVDTAHKKGLVDDTVEDWLHRRDARLPGEVSLDMVGYHMARTVAGQHGEASLRDAIARGPDHLIAAYNALGPHKLKN
ncbi:MAG: hypothetical protein JW910_20275 [Anaerolineae bacterium]|nr:hypothetical protein [Anaerolineae bacterium]